MEINGYEIESGADLEGANLKGADLEGADLKLANFEDADLTGANIEGANLEGANLRNADLEGANLRWADLRNADLEGANLEEANLRNANLRCADLRWADLRNADLKLANIEGANLKGANLRWANLEGANLKGADLKGADLEGADLRGAVGLVKKIGVVTGNYYYKYFNDGLKNNGYQFKVGLNKLRNGEVFASDDRVVCSYPGFHFASESWCDLNYGDRPLKAKIRIPEGAQINEPWASDGKASADMIEIIQVWDSKTGEDVTDKYR